MIFLPFNWQISDVAYELISRLITDYEQSRPDK